MQLRTWFSHLVSVHVAPSLPNQPIPSCLSRINLCGSQIQRTSKWKSTGPYAQNSKNSSKFPNLQFKIEPLSHPSNKCIFYHHSLNFLLLALYSKGEGNPLFFPKNWPPHPFHAPLPSMYIISWQSLLPTWWHLSSFATCDSIRPKLQEYWHVYKVYL